MSLSKKYVLFITTVILLLISGCGGGGTSTNNSGDPTGSIDPTVPISEKQAIRFLNQATFGATEVTKKELQEKGYTKWVDDQLNAPSAFDSGRKWKGDTLASSTTNQKTYFENMIFIAKENDGRFDKTLEQYLSGEKAYAFNRLEKAGGLPWQMSAWYITILNAKNQLRHRMAYALSQIVVVSNAEPKFRKRGESLAVYYDLLAKHAFGNYRDLLIDMSQNPAMGMYLTFHGSKKSNGQNLPDENYAREIMQLFTIGVWELNLDGTPKIDSNGNYIPTYIQKDVEELARVFTGWDQQHNNGYFGKAAGTRGNYTIPMEFNKNIDGSDGTYHDFDEKRLLGQTITAGLGGVEDITRAIDILMANPNIAPNISKLLIKRLTISNPSPAYVERVAKVFNDNGNGVKGDLKAVARAIFLDTEALDETTYQKRKFKEPTIGFVQLLRAFDLKPLSGKTLQVGDTTDIFGQAPTRQFTVFNFYEPDFIPTDSEFMNKKITAPEATLHSDQSMVNYYNTYWSIFNNQEKNLITLNDANALNSFVGTKFIKGYISFDEEYDIMEKIIDGDTNRDFQNIYTQDANGTTQLKKEAIRALVEHLDMKLTANSLIKEQKDIIIDFLNMVQVRSKIEGYRFKTAHQIVSEAVLMIITSDAYAVE